MTGLEKSLTPPPPVKTVFSVVAVTEEATKFLRGQLKRKRSRDVIQGDLHARREIPRKAEPAGKAEVLEGERPPQRRHIIRAEEQPSVQRGLIPFDFEAGPFDGDLRERGTLKEGAQRGFRRERKQDMDGNGLAFQ